MDTPQEPLVGHQCSIVVGSTVYSLPCDVPITLAVIPPLSRGEIDPSPFGAPYSVLEWAPRHRSVRHAVEPSRFLVRFTHRDVLSEAVGRTIRSGGIAMMNYERQFDLGAYGTFTRDIVRRSSHNTPAWWRVNEGPGMPVRFFFETGWLVQRRVLLRTLNVEFEMLVVLTTYFHAAREISFEGYDCNIRVSYRRRVGDVPTEFVLHDGPVSTATLSLQGQVLLPGDQLVLLVSILPWPAVNDDPDHMIFERCFDPEGEALAYYGMDFVTPTVRISGDEWRESGDADFAINSTTYPFLS